MGYVVITGGKSGLGLELATAFEAAGHQVIVGCRDAAAAPVGEAYELDMADEASIASFTQAVGDRPVSVLINNAGIDARNGTLTRPTPPSDKMTSSHRVWNDEQPMHAIGTWGAHDAPMEQPPRAETRRG